MDGKEKVFGDYKVIWDERDGYRVVNTKTFHEYSLLEGTSFGGMSTSDLVIIFDYEPTTGEDAGKIVDFKWGADDDDEDFDFIVNQIKKYEKN